MRCVSAVLAPLFLGLALSTSVTAQEPSFIRFGSGCPGSFGTPSLDAAPGSLPRLGDVFTSTLGNVPMFGFAIGFTGLSKTHWNLLALPLDLTVVGMPGCELFVEARQQTALAINGGMVDWNILIPSGSIWLGASIYQQVLVIDTSVPGLGAVMTGAAELVIGGVGTPATLVDETFDDDLMMDLNRSSGSWGRGMGTFGKAGGDGRLGDFDFADGRALNVEQTIWEWNTAGMTIVSDELLSSNFLNQSVPVNDGVFQFTDFVLPEEITLRFVGRNPVRILVRGRCEILGRIEVNGIDNTGLWAGKTRDLAGDPMPLPQLGQSGSFGGSGGGRGGRGAATAAAGQSGTDVKLLAGNVYLDRRVGTGGSGGPVMPSHGDPSLIDFTTPPPAAFGVVQKTYSQYVTAGGGGGGFFQPGEDGRALTQAFRTNLFFPVVVPPLDPIFIGPNAGGGILFDFLPKPDAESSDHYVIGGSGGGGGGSQAIFGVRSEPPALNIEPVLFNSGAGGAGGGGAIAIRVGRSLKTRASSVIECRGGSAADQTRIPIDLELIKFPDGIAAPGGGGSGGSILLMVDGDGDLQGTLDVSPGRGGVAVLELTNPPLLSQFAYGTRGGDGAPGYMRLEVADPNPTLHALGNHVPAGSGEVAQIDEEWPEVAFQSLWYETGQASPPAYLRYEILAEVDGVATTFSDDSRVGILAQHGDTPLAFYIQGADIFPGTGQVVNPQDVGGWRQYVGAFDPIPGNPTLNSDGKNGFRWVLILDRGFAGGDVVIKRVRIVFAP